MSDPSVHDCPFRAEDPHSCCDGECRTFAARLARNREKSRKTRAQRDRLWGIISYGGILAAIAWIVAVAIFV